MTRIDDLIEALQKVKSEKGNIPVVCGSFCGTNQAYVSFDIKCPKKKEAVVNHVNGRNQLVLSVEVAASSKASIRKGIKDMERLGHKFYLSQFVETGDKPKEGLSPCEWHGLW